MILFTLLIKKLSGKLDVIRKIGFDIHVPQEKSHQNCELTFL